MSDAKNRERAVLARVDQGFTWCGGSPPSRALMATMPGSMATMRFRFLTAFIRVGPADLSVRMWSERPKLRCAALRGIFKGSSRRRRVASGKPTPFVKTSAPVPPLPAALVSSEVSPERLGLNGHSKARRPVTRGGSGEGVSSGVPCASPDRRGIKAESWSGRRDLNPRRRAPKARALPDCATPRAWPVDS